MSFVLRKLKFSIDLSFVCTNIATKGISFNSIYSVQPNQILLFVASSFFSFFFLFFFLREFQSMIPTLDDSFFIIKVRHQSVFGVNGY